MEKLAKLFGSIHRVKIMRLFLFNQEEVFVLEDIVKRTKVKKEFVNKEIKLLEGIGFIKKKTFTGEHQVKSRKKGVKYETKKKKMVGLYLNTSFEFVLPLQTLLVDSELVKEKDIVKEISSAGTVKLLALSGVFTRDEDRALDILIVGDKLNKSAAERALKTLESEIGRELRYAIFDTDEFEYRISMYDKLIRDIFDYKHIKLIDKITINID